MHNIQRCFFFKQCLIFFITPRHPELVSGSHFIFSKIIFDSFSFLSLLYFYFFHKNYYHFTKGKKPARSPKPAVSFPLNPFLFGHGLGLCPKNLPASEIEVSSVSCEQIRVALFFFKIVFDFFYHTTSSRTRFGISFYFFKIVFWFFFLSLLCFYFFHKNYYYII